jgi:small subunit ribosomal protein S21
LGAEDRRFESFISDQDKYKACESGVMVATLVLEASAEMRESSSLSSRTNNNKEIVLRNLKGKRIKEFGSVVVVEDGKFEKAMRQFKKKVEDSGLLMNLRERQAYIKPTTKRKVAKNAAKKRWKKKLALQSMPEKLY